MKEPTLLAEIPRSDIQVLRLYAVELVGQPTLVLQEYELHRGRRKEVWTPTHYRVGFDHSAIPALIAALGELMMESCVDPIA